MRLKRECRRPVDPAALTAPQRAARARSDLRREYVDSQGVLHILVSDGWRVIARDGGRWREG